MTHVIGIGETVLDIIFDDHNQPVSARPGGSAYNALISLGRMGIDCSFVSMVGNDRVGSIIKDFLTANGVDNRYVTSYDKGNSPLALAFLDEHRNAQYSFYKDYLIQPQPFAAPPMTADDIVLIGSYFALNPVTRPQVRALLSTARQSDCLIYYDVNFRSTHRHEVDQLMPTIVENFQLADIVKGSDEDFDNIFGTTDFRRVYHEYVEPHCQAFICTQGSQGATLLMGSCEWHVDAQHITPVSTIGAGDNFNAGTIYGLAQRTVARRTLAPAPLAEAMKSGIAFASEVCQSYDNYISKSLNKVQSSIRAN